ncbi:helix-turn-helix domain-containing protein [Burkholderia vietnamiensis]|uniref:helix-turn-helix domain-containing protein n=1 Tax=Burkholderia vietnamiensis TaxID=60552 RepID=UPI001CF3F92E|nr:helix-turn-helix domain-containing protein [Burkholderia vietnamiensis]MCA8448883.1 helix-turn-helix domain-containing protein [Burkholderia vietnamiensis]
MTTQKNENFITAAEAARMMHLKSSEAVAYHVKRGHLPSVPHQHTDGSLGFRLRRSDVQAFIDESVAADLGSLFNVEEAARRLGMTAPQAVRLVNAGRLQPAKQKPTLGARGRYGLRFRQENLDQFLAAATDPASAMTVTEVRQTLNLLGDDQVLHLARTRGWHHLTLREKDGTERLYVQRADVEAFHKAGDNPLSNRYSVDQAAVVIGHTSPIVFRRARQGLLGSVRDHGRWWLDADDVHARRDEVAGRPPRKRRARKEVA